MAAPSITPPPPDTKPRLAVYKFSSCDGCQLSLLNLEEQLLSLVSAVEIAYFLEARRRVLPPPYDVGLVEGSISTPEEEHRIRQARRDCKFLVAIGACATSGGIQALRNWANLTEYMGGFILRRNTSNRWRRPRRSPRTSSWTSSCAAARSTRSICWN